MIDKNSQNTFEEFVKFCDIFLAKAKCSKEDLAEKLGMEYTHFSKVYNGHRSVPPHALIRIRELAEVPISAKFDNPEKAKIRDGLPDDFWKMREEISQIRALLEENRKDKNDLMRKMAVLERDLEQAKNDSEKKIRTIVGKAIRDEAERIAGQFEDNLPGQREAAG